MRFQISISDNSFVLLNYINHHHPTHQFHWKPHPSLSTCICLSITLMVSINRIICNFSVFNYSTGHAQINSIKSIISYLFAVCIDGFPRTTTVLVSPQWWVGVWLIFLCIFVNVIIYSDAAICICWLMVGWMWVLLVAMYVSTRRDVSFFFRSQPSLNRVCLSVC